MALNLPYTYAWQNPVLRETIYPYRLEKLRDFLLIYEEIDLWKQLKNGPIDPALEKEIRDTLPGLQAELDKDQAQNKTLQNALSLLVKKLSQIERLPEIRKILTQIASLEQENIQLNVRRRLLEGYIQWSLKIAPDNDPVRPKRQAELEQVQAQIEENNASIAALKQEYDETFLPLKEQEEKLEETASQIAARIEALAARLKGFPLLKPTQPITPQLAARWVLNQYREKLEKLDQEELLQLAWERFEREPQRFPGWLQYMVIHFSGMRYKSAHGSWADPRRLLQKILEIELEQQINNAADDQIEAATREILASIQRMLTSTLGKLDQDRLNRWIQKLSVVEDVRRDVFRTNPEREPLYDQLSQIEKKIANLSQLFITAGPQPNHPTMQLIADLEEEQRQTTQLLGNNQVAELKKRMAAGFYWLRKNLLAYRLERMQDEIKQMTDLEVLSDLAQRKTRMPVWAWKEIVRRTELRLAVDDPDWETPSGEELKAKNVNEKTNHYWRQTIYEWETRDITAWRAKHAQDLSLVVTRAVCNEISEHILHIRGRTPPGGLTAKPLWYLANQDTMAGKAFFTRPARADEILPGASLLFLGWVSSKPHAWAIASPLRQIEMIMPDGQPLRNGRKDAKGEYQYQIAGSEIYRTSQISVAVQPSPPIPPANIKTRPKQFRKGQKTNANAAIQRAKTQPKKFKKQLRAEWLRWTHEAIVVEVAEMIDGVYVLTFETGEIGLNIRPLNRLLSEWDIYIGYVPAAETERPELAGFLDPARLFPKP